MRWTGYFEGPVGDWGSWRCSGEGLGCFRCGLGAVGCGLDLFVGSLKVVVRGLNLVGTDVEVVWLW